MADDVTKSAKVKFGADTKEFDRAVRATQKRVKQLNDSASKLATRATALFTAASVAGGTMLRVYRDQERSEKQLEAAIRATGQAQSISVKWLKQIAGAYQKTTEHGDETSLMLFTYGLRIGNLNKHQLPTFMRMAGDFASATGRALPRASRQLAGALADPATAISTLTRLGVVFTKEEREMVKVMADSGKVAQAKTFLLGRMARQYEGAAAAAASGSGVITQLKNAFFDFYESIGREWFRRIKDSVIALRDFFTNVESGGNRIAYFTAKIFPFTIALAGISLAAAGVSKALAFLLPLLNGTASAAKRAAIGMKLFWGAATIGISTAVAFWPEINRFFSTNAQRAADVADGLQDINDKYDAMIERREALKEQTEEELQTDIKRLELARELIKTKLDEAKAELLKAAVHEEFSPEDMMEGGYMDARIATITEGIKAMEEELAQNERRIEMAKSAATVIVDKEQEMIDAKRDAAAEAARLAAAEAQASADEMDLETEELLARLRDRKEGISAEEQKFRERERELKRQWAENESTAEGVEYEAKRELLQARREELAYDEEQWRLKLAEEEQLRKDEEKALQEAEEEERRAHAQAIEERRLRDQMAWNAKQETAQRLHKRAMLAIESSFTDLLASLTQGRSKKLNAIIKILRIKETLMSGWANAAKAYGNAIAQLGPILGPPVGTKQALGIRIKTVAAAASIAAAQKGGKVDGAYTARDSRMILAQPGEHIVPLGKSWDQVRRGIILDAAATSAEQHARNQPADQDTQAVDVKVSVDGDGLGEFIRAELARERTIGG